MEPAQSPLLKGLEENLSNMTTTENGALAYKRSGNELVDAFERIGGSRQDPEAFWSIFLAAYYTDALKALKILFYGRNPRGGMGERQLFRHTISNMASNADPQLVEHLIMNLGNISLLGRWDDLLCLIDEKRQIDDHGPTVGKMVMDYLGYSLSRDLGIDPEHRNSPISLLAKWLPSDNTSSRKTRALASKLKKQWGMSSTEYRGILKKLRQQLGDAVVETKMSRKKFETIDFSKVCSKAMLTYSKSFLKHDLERYEAWQLDVAEGKSKVNASVLYPYEIVRSAHQVDLIREESALAESEILSLDNQWNALPDYLTAEDGSKTNALAVIDVSSSMHQIVSGKTSAMDVAISLGIYIAQRCSNAFQGSFMTFASNPSLVQLEGDNIVDIIHNVAGADWGGSTNLIASFELILKVAKEKQLDQKDLPEWIFIPSDCEFDYQVRISDEDHEMTPHQTIARKFTEAGYVIPKLVYWNLCSRQQQVPMSHNDYGMMVSGFSPAILKAVFAAKEITPTDVMEAAINDPVYDCIKIDTNVVQDEPRQL